MKYKLTTQVLRLGKEAGKKKVFGRPVIVGRMTFNKFCREVADGSTVSTADAKAVIDRMVVVLRRRIEEGYSVECGELGIFRPSFGCSGADDEKSFDAKKHIKRPRIVFTPRKEFSTFTDMTFERVNPEAKEKADKQPDPSPDEREPSPSDDSGL